jgi:hypothetical protein
MTMHRSDVDGSRWWRACGLALLAHAAAGCSTDAGAVGEHGSLGPAATDTGVGDSGENDDDPAAEDGDDTGAGGDTGNPTDDGGSETDDGGAEIPAPSLEGLDFRCKVINAESVEAPTANHTHTRFNLRGTDLGIPVVIGDLLHVFFGDTHGYREIWAIGEDPDSVAFVDAEAAATDPGVLCSDLSFYVTPDVPSVAADTDPTVERDFAAGWMFPPPGEELSSYITHHPAPFPNIPGSFEVPSGALALESDVYLFWAGKSEFEPHHRMTLSYLVRWDPPRQLPEYQIVRPIDSLYDGALGGHFIQILPLLDGDTLYLFGTGEFRRSGIYLARMPVRSLETGAGVEVYDPSSGAWLDPATLDSRARAAIPPVVETGGVGELGGLFVPGPDVFLLMYQHATIAGDQLASNRVVVRTAPTPTGPWSEQITAIDMFDPAFMLEHCCLSEPCGDAQIWKCDAAGLYGAYPLPTPKVQPRTDGRFDVELPFLVSTWIPYNVVMFEARLALSPG